MDRIFYKNHSSLARALLALAAVPLLAAGPALGQVKVQCPGDTNSDAVPDIKDPDHPQVTCRHLTGGDGFATMADGTELYVFGFADVTGMPESHALMHGMLAANTPAPTLALDEGDELYLTLTNVGMMMRPDLFDPHSVHFHGFPNAAATFDGLPEASVSVNMGSSLTYYYSIVTPGTFFYHCHVEATEHIQMGMLGNLWVRPAQNRLPDGTVLGSHVHSNPDWDQPVDNPLVGDTYAYNDGDGSTRYDVEYPMLISGFDYDFHTASHEVQALPFAMMTTHYPMLNGRGYPDTAKAGPLPASASSGTVGQKVSSLVKASKGQRILLRIANVDVTRYETLSSVSLPMLVIAKDAKLLRGPTGKTLYYKTQSVTLGGGETYDVIIDTKDAAPGTYFLYSGNLNLLSNFEQDFGGLMTEIQIAP